jgi:hypothetical protein
MTELEQAERDALSAMDRIVAIDMGGPLVGSLPATEWTVKSQRITMASGRVLCLSPIKFEGENKSAAEAFWTNVDRRVGKRVLATASQCQSGLGMLVATLSREDV